MLEKIIKAYDIRGLVKDEITPDFSFSLGIAFAKFLEYEREPATIVVGEDMRPSSPLLADAFSDGVISQGMDVIRIGLASTDMLYFASGKLNLPGIMFTASHNPAKYNGMAGFTAPAVMERLNIDLIPMYFELDGNFPNHEANPIEAKNLKDLQKRVKKEKADIGLAFDGDADRCFLINEKGELVNPSALTSLIAVHQLKTKPGSTIIYNLISSKAVSEVIAENGGIGVRSRVGHSYIKSLMAESGAIFGGEHSGHFYFSNFWRADSGMLAALYALTELMATKNTLSELLRPFNRYVASGEINSKVKNVEKSIELIRKKYCDKYLVDELDGLTITADSWWFNLRPSNTEPLLRLNVEADTEKEMVKIRDTVLSLI